MTWSRFSATGPVLAVRRKVGSERCRGVGSGEPTAALLGDVHARARKGPLGHAAATALVDDSAAGDVQDDRAPASSGRLLGADHARSPAIAQWTDTTPLAREDGERDKSAPWWAASRR